MDLRGALALADLMDEADELASQLHFLNEEQGLQVFSAALGRR